MNERLQLIALELNNVHPTIVSSGDYEAMAEALNDKASYEDVIRPGSVGRSINGGRVDVWIMDPTQPLNQKFIRAVSDCANHVENSQYFDNITNWDAQPVQIQEAMRDGCKKLLGMIQSNRPINMMDNDEEGRVVKSLFQLAVQIGVISQEQLDRFERIGGARQMRFGNVTSLDCRKALHPPIKRLCQHETGAMDYLVSANPKNALLATTIVLNVETNVVNLSLRWRSVDDQGNFGEWNTFPDVIPIRINNSVVGSPITPDTFKLPNVRGLYSKGRHFEFTLEEDFANQVDSIQIGLLS